MLCSRPPALEAWDQGRENTGIKVAGSDTGGLPVVSDKGASLGTRMVAIRRQRPQLISRLRPDLPGELVHLVHQLLEKKPPRRRPARADEVARRFDALAQAG